jgi:hypothetical protein
MTVHRLILTIAALASAALASDQFSGKFFRGTGDVEYLQYLDIARRMFAPDAEFQSLPMLYTPKWNGFVEGPTWGAWWIQNSYGTTYCALPFLGEPYTTFLKNSHDLWWDQMGDGKRVGATDKPRHMLVAPDGALCDAASPGWIVYKQGDGRMDLHDWAFEFTAAGVLMQAELLLISRDPAAIAHYLPKMERSVAFIESRRDPKNNLFLVGAAANLLAPSYAGWKKPDGTYGRAYLAGLSVTHIAALDRMIELEKLAGRAGKAAEYAALRASARKGLAELTTPEGYFVKSVDPDGTRHGVYGAARHGYFETPPNHDAIAFRVVDDTQADRIFAKMASIPQLRPYDFIIPNYPSLDDMYAEMKGIWRFGHWVNGGHWSTCEGRMIMAYYRLGKYEDARRSMRQLLKFARAFRMDNPLTDFGNAVYQPKLAINITYDAFAPAAALVRGLFEYLYSAEGVKIVPHIPPGIRELQQLFPIRFGSKKLFLSVLGTGPITTVRVNGKPWKKFDAASVWLPYAETPESARVVIARGGLKSDRPAPREDVKKPPAPANASLDALDELALKAAKIYGKSVESGRGASYEAAHARLVVDMVEALKQRFALISAGKLKPLDEPAQSTADKLYVETVERLAAGLDTFVKP